MAELKTEQVTTHTLVLTDAELTEWRQAALCALRIGDDTDPHRATWHTISGLGLPPTRGDRGQPLPPRLVKVDGVLTEGDADTAREALRQMNPNPRSREEGLADNWEVQPYTDHGAPRYVFRCWGTDDGCEGLVSLDHTTRTSAESARDRHVAEAHAKGGGGQ